MSNAAAQKLDHFKRKRAANSVYTVLVYISYQMYLNNGDSRNNDDDLNIIPIIITSRSKPSSDSSSNHGLVLNEMLDNNICQFCVELDFSEATPSTFKGARADSGAQLFCIDKKRALSYSYLI